MVASMRTLCGVHQGRPFGVKIAPSDFSIVCQRIGTELMKTIAEFVRDGITSLGDLKASLQLAMQFWASSAWCAGSALGYGLV
jgi:hypothetical protein